MGTITFQGKLIYNKPFAIARVISNWNDSMGQYYPYVAITIYNGDNNLEYEQIGLPVDSPNPEITIEPCPYMAFNYECHLKKVAYLEERERVAFGKNVIVIKGRKLPIGTIGDVFWIGNSGWGESVGLRLLDGRRVFTSLTNVKTYYK